MIKNQIRVTLCGTEFYLKPTFGAIMKIEEKLGGILPLALKISDGQVTCSDVVHVIYACLPKDHGFSFEQLGEAVLSKGLASVIPAVRDIMTICLAGELEEKNP
jgi:hypothetical protein